MIAAVLEAVAGVLLAAATLQDVFDTVLVPGESRGPLRIMRRLVQFGLAVGRLARRKQVGASFAPLVMVASFVSWMLLLVVAFGLMAHAARAAFSRELAGLGEALFVAGGAMTTMGFGSITPHGVAMAITVAASFCGLAVMTLAVTYLLEVQGNIAQRDSAVLKITTAAGVPPSALGLLERYAALGCQRELVLTLRAGRDWCAGVLQSHVTHPSLIYFRSAATHAGWPATLGALVDLTLIVGLLLDDEEAAGPAALLRDEAERLACELCKLLDLAPVPVTDSRADVELLCRKLQAAGYRLREGRNAASFIAARARHAGPVLALNRHLGTPEAPLLQAGEAAADTSMAARA